jgi:hypothetical protein
MRAAALHFALAAPLALRLVNAITQATDWLVNDVVAPSQLITNPDGSVSLTNGLITRTFSTCEWR